jgi:hypothetical protein
LPTVTAGQRTPSIWLLCAAPLSKKCSALFGDFA